MSEETRWSFADEDRRPEHRMPNTKCLACGEYGHLSVDFPQKATTKN